ncbi:MAG: RNA methyltransferase [Deltaproteobacteria bacterium]|nr:RNA methyltransferase [Deltaproteobacteria bacterium]
MLPHDLPHLVRIASLSDPRLDDYRDVRDRDLATRGFFLGESESVLRVLVGRKTHPLRSVLVGENRVAKLAPVLAKLPASVPVFLGSQPVLDGVTGFHIHRGVLAAAERTPVPDAVSWLGALPLGPATVLVLEGVNNHDNVGSIFRNGAALGATGVVLDARSCDPLYRKAIRVSVGGCLVLPYARCDAARNLFPTLRAAGFAIAALTPNEPAVDLDDYRRVRPPRVALLLGSEGPGLEPETLATADVRLRIRQRGDFDSLNVATASGIALHALTAAAR